jgi:hypothetical protein
VVSTYDVIDDWYVGLDSDSHFDRSGEETTPGPRESNMTVSLSDIARLFKPRGQLNLKLRRFM